MLACVSADISRNAISNLDLWRSYTTYCSELVLPPATNLSNICCRVYWLTVDAIRKQLLSQNKVSLALGRWTSTNTLAIMLVPASNMDRNWALQEIQLAIDEVDSPFFSFFERRLRMIGQRSTFWSRDSSTFEGGTWSFWVVLATVPTRYKGSRSGLESEPNRCNRFYHTKTQTVAIGPELPPNSRHFNLTTLSPMKYLSSDRIVTWSICSCAVLAALSPPTIRFAIWPVLVELLWKSREFHIVFHVIPQRFHKYWSDHKSEWGRLKSCKSCTIYVLIMSRYDANPDTYDDAMLVAL